MSVINTTDRKKLKLHIMHELGWPQRDIFEPDDNMFESYIEMVIEDYSAILNSWLIEQQWVNIQGLEVDSNDFVNAFTTKTNDFMRSFTVAYSKQVGLGTNAPANNLWELKRDYITTMENTQHYVIPANREVNEVLWETPSGVDQGLIDPMASTGWQSGQFGWSYMGRPAQVMQPTYALLLAAQDRRMKQRVMQSTLSYRITGLATGEKLLHLYPIPGSKAEISGKWGKHYEGRKVWYFYYDTTNGSAKDCLKKNKDVVTLPSEAPLENLKWDKLNSVSRTYIRNLLIAKVKIVIGGIRGFYSGNIGATSKEIAMDYRHLLDEGNKLKDETEKDIRSTLEKLSLTKLTEDRANIAININRERGFQPFNTPIILF